jgi:alkane 1-monooxygenase
MLSALPRSASPFAVATLVPAALLALGAVTGGPPIWAALVWMTLLPVALDRLGTSPGPEAAPGVEFPAGDRLAVALGAAHFGLLALAVLALPGATGLTAAERIAAFLAFGLFFGQVGNANAHELIHRSDRALARLGKWVFISLAYGHHVTAHPRIHHRYVGTDDDPATARLGESFWNYVPRAWWGAFRAGFEIEAAIAAVAGRRLALWQHPYAEHLAGTAGVAALAFLIGGWGGLVAWVLLCAHAQVQILLSDYVQHYGLRRARGPDGRPEPVAPWHSWNAPHWFSAGLMLNAPRHSDHHVHPARPFPALELPDAAEAPRLPHPLPVMAVIALVPHLWHRMMDHRARDWQKRIDSGALSRAAVLARAEAARRARHAGVGRRPAAAGPAQAAQAATAVADTQAFAAGGAAPPAAPRETGTGVQDSRHAVSEPRNSTPEARPLEDPDEARLRRAVARAIEEAEIDEAVPAPDKGQGSAREVLTRRPETQPLRADDPIAGAVARAITAAGVVVQPVERLRRAALLPELAPAETTAPHRAGLLARASAAARALGRSRGKAGANSAGPPSAAW